MENASKALLMAAGVLVGIIILSMFAYEMIYMSNNAQEFQEQAYVTQITEFNAKFEKYVGNEKILTAHDVVTLFGYVNEWNENNLSEPMIFEASSGSISVRNLISTKDIGKFMDSCYIGQSDGTVKEIHFKCTLGYNENNTAARVNKVTITQIIE